jgi:hypothetical protein
VFPARYELNSYIVFGKRLVSRRLSVPQSPCCVLLFSSALISVETFNELKMKISSRERSLRVAHLLSN